MVSAPSLTEQSEYSPEKIYSGHDLHMVSGYYMNSSVMTAFGVKIATSLSNDLLVQHYDQNLIIPIPTMRKPRVMNSAIGKKPFVIELFFIADDNGASFKPSSTALFIRDNQQPLYPIHVYDSGGSVHCGQKHSGLLKGTLAKIDKLVNRESISLANKFNADGEEVESLGFWTCIALHFDVATPYPSERFYLNLGEIITSEGERIHSTIYFSPVVIRSGG